MYNSYKPNTNDKKDKTQTVENYTCDDSWNSSSYNCSKGCGYNGVGGEWICCPSGSELAWGYYCINLPTGTPCWFDTMCANGDCTGNGYGIRRGTCN